MQTAFKSIHNWRCYHSSKCYEIAENVQFRIWRSAVAPSDAAGKYGNIEIWAFMHVRDCSCAPVLQFFDAALDSATGNRQIPDRIFGEIF